MLQELHTLVTEGRRFSREEQCVRLSDGCFIVLVQIIKKKKNYRRDERKKETVMENVPSVIVILSLEYTESAKVK